MRWLKRRKARLATLVAVALAAGAGVAWLSASAPSAPVLNAPAAVIATGPAASAVAAVPAAPMPVFATAAPGLETVEVCGHGAVAQAQVDDWYRGRALGRDSPLLDLDRRRASAVNQLASRLAAGSDEDQVAARLLMQDVQGAAILAANSPSAAAYRLALSFCASPTDPQEAPACRALTPQGWAQRDPGDARPWLWLLAAAQARGDDAAASSAVEELLQRQSRGTSGWALLGPMARAAASIDEPAGLGLATVEAVGREAALTQPFAGALSRYCSAKAVAQGDRRMRCERVARWQFANANTVFDGAVALSIARRAGLPADQQPFTQAQLDAGQRALVESQQSQMDLSCAGLATAARWPQQLAQHTELDMALALSRPR